MENMEHTDAIRLQAVEKYILGELPPRARDEFETHYFDCVECSLNLRAGVAFAGASRQFFAEESARQADVIVPKVGWLAWLRPLVVVPTFAALLLVIGYQNAVSIPRLRETLASAPATATVTAVGTWFSLVDSNVKGPAGQTLTVPSGQSFSVFFDITAQPKSADSAFQVELVDPTGKTVSSAAVSAQAAQKPVLYTIPAPTREGEYKLIILEKAAGSTAKVSEISFTVAFSR
jgi:hypothetical protein